MHHDGVAQGILLIEPCLLERALGLFGIIGELLSKVNVTSAPRRYETPQWLRLPQERRFGDGPAIDAIDSAAPTAATLERVGGGAFSGTVKSP
jgi:hypothetical protein